MLRPLALLLLCLPASAALACSCVTTPLAQRLATADQVFIGRAGRLSADGSRCLFVVQQRFKGVAADTLSVRSEQSTSCALHFQPGQSWVVFARQGQAMLCSGSSLAAGSDDIGKLLYTFRRSFADSLGADAAPLLNASEARYFDLELQQQRGSFSFQHQRVAFFEGNHAAISDKQQYLRRWAGRFMAQQLLVLTPAERQQVGSYDAIIVFWRKITVSPAVRRRLVRRLTRHPTA